MRKSLQQLFRKRLLWLFHYTRGQCASRMLTSGIVGNKVKAASESSARSTASSTSLTTAPQPATLLHPAHVKALVDRH